MHFHKKNQRALYYFYLLNYCKIKKKSSKSIYQVLHWDKSVFRLQRIYKFTPTFGRANYGSFT